MSIRSEALSFAKGRLNRKSCHTVAARFSRPPPCNSGPCGRAKVALADSVNFTRGLLLIVVTACVWRDDDERPIPLAIDAQQRVALGLSGQPLEIGYGAHGTVIDFLNHVSRLQTCLRCRALRVEGADDYALLVRRQAELLANLRSQSLD